MALSLVLLGAASSAPAVASAEDVVLLYEAPALRPDLCVALRIQLTDVATVSCRTAEAEAALATRIASASRAVASEPARLAVLLERDPDPRRVRMFLVGASESQAVLAIEAIEDRAAPDIDRSLALKVRDTLEVLGASRELAEHRSALALTLAPLAPAGAPVAIASERGLRLLLEPGAAVYTGAHTRAAGLLALGVGVRRGARYGELLLSGQVSSSLDVERRGLGTIVENEWGLGLSLRAGRELGRFMLGGLGELSLVRVHAFGVTVDGTPGESTQLTPRLGLGPDLRVVLLRGAARLMLRFAPTLQIDLIARTFELDGESALELGRVHVWLPLSLLVELPLARGGARDDV